MDVKELKKIIDICRKSGVLELKFAGIEIKLAPEALKAKRPIKDKSPELTNTPTFSEEETLFWSTPGLPQAAMNG